MTGSGTEADPFVIYDVTDLQAMKDDLTAYYELANNIDATETSGWNGGDGFEPVGNLDGAGVGQFNGSLDGKAYTINDLYINRNIQTVSPVTNHLGLFGYAAGVIKNVNLVDVDITGTWPGGGGSVSRAASLVSSASATDPLTITNCSSSGNVTSYGDVGGLVARTESDTLITHSNSSCIVTSTNSDAAGFVNFNQGIIEYCRCSGAVTGGSTDEAGGFCESNTGTIRKSFSTGAVVSDERGGGFTRSNGGLIENCYSRGSITGNHATEEVGGFTQRNFGTIKNCYNTGAVSATVSAGFCQSNSGTITDCFWDTETTGEATSDGGTGKTTAEMKNEATFSDANYLLATVWNVLSGCNDGYPCLVGVNSCCAEGMEHVATKNKVALEAIRNVEFVYGGRFFIGKGGDATYQSRYHRNV